MTEDETTSPATPSAFQQILTELTLARTELTLVKRAAESSANEAVATRAAVSEFRAELSAFRGRLAALEAERLWFPMAISTLALLVALIALMRHG